MIKTSDPRALDFKRSIHAQFLMDVHRLEADNYDAWRYGFDGVDRSQLFDVARHVNYAEWFEEHYEDVFRLYERLADQASRDLLTSLVRYRLSGHLHVRIASRIQQLRPAIAEFLATVTGVPSQLPTSGMFGNLVHYDLEWDGERYIVDTIRGALVSTLVMRQYFFERDGIQILPEAGDVLIDGGCCTGDTTVVFSRAVGPSGRVVAFDPVQAHIDVCRHNFSRPGFDNVDIVEAGVSDRTVEAPPIEVDVYSPGWRVEASAGVTVPLMRIDDLLLDGRVNRIDYIKLDVEGSELAALRGGLAAIHKFKPKLAISLYHKPNDYFELTDFVHDLGLGYKMYLDHHTIHDEETVLYATCR